MSPLRIGILGAARIAPSAVVKPAREVDDVVVGAVAARDPARAKAFAARHGVPVAHGDYAALIADPELDAVYNPLPNGLHAEWTIKALAAGKHVLCEKPLTANAAEAREVAAAADKYGLVVMEAFHYRYHPLVARILGLIEAGTIGAVRDIRTSVCFPLPRFSDIRYSLALAGGATMDAGCYALHFLRVLGGAEPAVTSARAVLREAGVDRAMTAELMFPSGTTGRISTSLWSSKLLDISATVTGETGQIKVLNFVAPHIYHRLTVRAGGRTTRERVPGEASYTHQLRAFAAATLRGGENLTPPADSILTMTLIDDVYRAAGLRPRGT